MAESIRRNGLFYGWLIVAAGFFTLFVTTGARNAFGVFVIPMSEELEWTRSQVSAAGSLGILINGVTLPFIGRLHDRFGGRIVITISLGILGISTMLMSQINNIWMLVLLFGFVSSTATGGASMVTVHAMLSRWFSRRRGIALSLSTAGSSAGSLVLIPLATYLIITANWRVAWFVMGAFVLFLAMPLALIIFRDSPKDIGEEPEGEQSAGDGRKSAAAVLDIPPLATETWKDSFRSPPIWQLSGAYFVCGVTTAIISFHYVPFAIDRGISPAVAASAFGLMGGLNVVGVIIVGFLADRFSRKNLLGVVYAIRFCAYAILVLVPGGAGIWGFAVLAGLSWVATPPLTTSLTADIYGLRNLGTLGGISNMAHNFGGALSVLAAGVLYDAFGAYEIPFA
ncbi:MAG: MFS transporter, partial [Chloroflexi bacterium]|nr:MFS transporter [Chloroflexota bacterium]